MAYWTQPCPLGDHGVLKIRFSRGGLPVLRCDVCHSMWLDPADTAEDRVLFADPADTEGSYDDGNSVQLERPPATAEEIRRLGWWSYVDPRSRRRLLGRRRTPQRLSRYR